MVRSEEDTRKLEVAEDGRSIGYFEEAEDGGQVFHPLILWGFKLESYVSSELGPKFRGLQVKVKTNGGKVFCIEWRHKDILSCHEACVQQGYGDMFEYKPFDESLWCDLMVRSKFDSLEQGRLKYREPARNEGYQMAFLKELQMKHGVVKEEDIEYVTRTKVIGVDGIKEDPVHAVVQSATPEVDWTKPDFNLSGAKGFFKVFLPPHTSLDKEQRSIQTVILTSTLVQHYYPFIVDQLGECPGMMLASYEPETMKSTLSQVALKYFSTLDNFIESGSTKESMELKRSSSTNFCLWDDVEGAGGKEHSLWVGSMNGAAKHTISRGKVCKLAGTLLNKNLQLQESIHPKVLEGRLIWFLMNKATFHENQDLEENILSQQRHRLAMMQTSLPTDFLVKMVHHFITQPGEEFSKFQELHMEACLLLEIHRKQYRKRKLKSYALVLAVFMMIEAEVEESEDEQVKRMFVEVYGDRDSFLGAFVAELDKTDEIEKEMRSRQPRMARLHSMGQVVEDEMEEGIRNIDNNRSIINLINGMQHLEVAEVMRYMKIFPKKTRNESAWSLGIAHPRIKKNGSLKTIPIQLTGQQTTMQFTKMNSNQWMGRAATQAAICTTIAFNQLNDGVKERLKELFEPVLRKVMEQTQIEEEVPSDEEEERASEDYPRYGQSQTQNTLKTCTFCQYLTRNETDMNNHIEREHPKCDQCDTRTESGTTLTEHKKTTHNLFKCTICQQCVPTSESVEHMKMHRTQEQYNREITEGFKKPKPPRGWNIFLKTKKAELKAISPTMTHQLLTAQVSAKWKSLSKAEKQMWNLRAVQEEEARQVLESRQVPVQVEQRQVEQRQAPVQTEQVEVEQVEVEVELEQGMEEVQAMDVDLLLQENGSADDLTFSTMENLVFGTVEVPEPEPGPSSLHCPMCAFSSMDQMSLKQHIDANHQETEEREGTSARHKVLVDLSCPHCDFTSHSKESWKIHIKSHRLRQSRISSIGDMDLDLTARAEVVLHKLKKLEWPAVVKETCGNTATIQLLNKARSTREVDISTIRPFAMASISSKNSELRQAYLEAQGMQ